MGHAGVMVLVDDGIEFLAPGLQRGQGVAAVGGEKQATVVEAEPLWAALSWQY
jgi:hypothetical protein